MIGHDGFFRVFASTRAIRGCGHFWRIYSQTCPNHQRLVGIAVAFRTVPLSLGRIVPKVTIVEG